MEVRNPKLKQIVMSMDNNKAHAYIVDQLDLVKSQAEEDRWCEVGNGEKVKKLTREVVANTNDDVVIIKNAVGILIDLQTIVNTVKKYRKTRYFVTLITLAGTAWRTFL